VNTDELLAEIYDYIHSFKSTNGYSPNQEEIAQALGMTKALVVQTMNMMEAEGMIVQPRGLLTAIKLLSRQPTGKRVIRGSASVPHPPVRHR
jgi:DNA-binding MarR family transcriptional regulator